MSAKDNLDIILSGDSSGVEEIGKAITHISDAFIKINNGPLTRRALILLIKDASSENLTNAQIAAVLDTVPKLKTLFTKISP